MTPASRAVAAAVITALALLSPTTSPIAQTGAAAVTDAAPLQGPASLDADLRRVVSGVRVDAIAAGVSWRVLDTSFTELTPDPSLLDLLAAQPEHVMAPWDYMGRIVSDKRIADGRAMLAAHKPALDDIEARFGVDRHVVVAVWGIESSFGALPGTRPVVRSLATLAAADRRRAAFWRKELVAALQILERGDVTADRMTGSWAGAMGHTQFMPSTYLAHAVDFDGDGRRDIWQSVPDALASTANYLRHSGWRSGEVWGQEVVLPAGFDYRLASTREARPAADWLALGIAPPAGAPWPEQVSRRGLLVPAGMHGPAFLVGDNFQAILKYNNAVPYALAVGHLADRLADKPPLAALWPTHDPPLDRAGRVELQQRLSADGHAVGAIDGVIGDGTRDALRAWQDSRGMPADGWPGTQLLGRLRSAAGATQDF